MDPRNRSSLTSASGDSSTQSVDGGAGTSNQNDTADAQKSTHNGTNAEFSDPGGSGGDMDNGDVEESRLVIDESLIIDDGEADALAEQEREIARINADIEAKRRAAIKKAEELAVAKKQAIENAKTKAADKKRRIEAAEKLKREQEEAAEKRRLELEAAEKLRLEEEAAEKRRLEQEAVEKRRLEEAAKKRRQEDEVAKKRRLEQEAAEKRRLEQEAAEKLRLEKESVDRRRLEKEAAKKRTVGKAGDIKLTAEDNVAARRRIEKEEAARRQAEREEDERLARDQRRKNGALERQQNGRTTRQNSGSACVQGIRKNLPSVQPSATSSILETDGARLHVPAPPATPIRRTRKEASPDDAVMISSDDNSDDDFEMNNNVREKSAATRKRRHTPPSKMSGRKIIQSHVSRRRNARSNGGGMSAAQPSKKARSNKRVEKEKEQQEKTREIERLEIQLEELIEEGVLDDLVYAQRAARTQRDAILNERAKVEAERNSALMEEKVRMAQVNALAMKRDSDAQVDELDKQELLQVIAKRTLDNSPLLGVIGKCLVRLMSDVRVLKKSAASCQEHIEEQGQIVRVTQMNQVRLSLPFKSRAAIREFWSNGENVKVLLKILLGVPWTSRSWATDVIKEILSPRMKAFYYWPSHKQQNYHADEQMIDPCIVKAVTVVMMEKCAKKEDFVESVVWAQLLRQFSQAKTDFKDGKLQDIDDETQPLIHVSVPPYIKPGVPWVEGEVVYVNVPNYGVTKVKTSPEVREVYLAEQEAAAAEREAQYANVLTIDLSGDEDEPAADDDDAGSASGVSPIDEDAFL